MQKAYRFRLYPTDGEMQQMIRIIGCCRFTYNRPAQSLIREEEKAIHPSI